MERSGAECKRFEVENQSGFKVSVLVDGKVVECPQKEVIKIEGKKTDIYLPEFKDQEISKSKTLSTWSNYTCQNHEINLWAMEYSYCEFAFPINPVNGFAKEYVTFRFISEDGKLKKVICVPSDGKLANIFIKYQIPIIKDD